MVDDAPVVVVGAGQAGLAVSCRLSEAGVPHVVLERGRVGETWRRRWDSFCLVTPNWTAQLPEHPYDGDDPDGFMPRDEVVADLVATGAYQRPHRLAAAATLPAGVQQLDADTYRSPGAVAPGAVLVVGSGQSGCQIAEELREAGREVLLACGRAPWAPRRIGDHDLLWWAVETGFWDADVRSLPHPGARLSQDRRVAAVTHGSRRNSITVHAPRNPSRA